MSITQVKAQVVIVQVGILFMDNTPPKSYADLSNLSVGNST